MAPLAHSGWWMISFLIFPSTFILGPFLSRPRLTWHICPGSVCLPSASASLTAQTAYLDALSSWQILCEREGACEKYCMLHYCTIPVGSGAKKKKMMIILKVERKQETTTQAENERENTIWERVMKKEWKGLWRKLNIDSSRSRGGGGKSSYWGRFIYTLDNL